MSFWSDGKSMICHQEFHGKSAVMRLAERYKGLAILWEHRYYGVSLPFPVNVSDWRLVRQ